MCKCKVEPVVFDEVRFLEGRPGRFKKVEGFSGVGCRLRGLTPKSGYSTYSYEGFSEAQVNAINGLIGGPGYGEPDLEETVQRMVDKAVLAAVNTLFLKGITVALESSPEPEIDVPDDAERLSIASRAKLTLTRNTNSKFSPFATKRADDTEKKNNEPGMRAGTCEQEDPQPSPNLPSKTRQR